jgi:hypothetical protein
VRVRQCPVCKGFFFALRKDQKACSTRCNAARRVRQWRANQVQYEYRRKLRSAGLEVGKSNHRCQPRVSTANSVDGDGFALDCFIFPGGRPTHP